MTPTLFSISYAGFWGQDSLDLSQFIPRAASLGYSAVMLDTQTSPHRGRKSPPSNFRFSMSNRWLGLRASWGVKSCESFRLTGLRIGPSMMGGPR